MTGVVVLYNPDIKKVYLNSLTYIKYLDILYLIDNSEISNKKNIEKEFFYYRDKIKYLWLGENKGIARALNLAKQESINSNYKFMLTMDQDSYFETDLKEMIDIIKKNKEKKIGIVAPNYNIYGKEQKLEEKIIKRKYVMTSGNILNLKYAKEIGDFNEEFFIDEVDNEYCLRMRKRNYEVVKYMNCSLRHELGKEKKFFGVKVITHNYIRQYYMTRNKLYVLKEFKEVRIKYLILIFIEIFKVILFEKNRKKSLIFIFKGIKDFLCKKAGKLEKY